MIMSVNSLAVNLDTWLLKATQQLKSAGIGTARLDALVLLEDSLGNDRAFMLAHPEDVLSQKVVQKLDLLVARRATHEPLAYIRGKTEFYGRDFYIDKRVLEPRPESEAMMDLLKKLPLDKPAILDIGTGSGALGITAAIEVLDSRVELIDIDEACLAVVRNNLKKFGLNLPCYKSDLLTDTAGQYDVLLANLPYVPTSYTINKAALQEPHIAIFGGTDGLDLYRQLFTQLQASPSSYILTESLPFQHEALEKIAQSSGYKLESTDDFIQLFKH
jgi:release factor glutamine methyltransferase